MPYPVAAVRMKIQQVPPLTKVNLVSNGTFDANINGWTPYEAPGWGGDTSWSNAQYHSSPGCFKIYASDNPKYVLSLNPSITELSMKLWVKLPVFEPDATVSFAFGGVNPDFDWKTYTFISTDWALVEWTVHNNHALTELIILPPMLWDSEYIYVDDVEVYDIS